MLHGRQMNFEKQLHVVTILNHVWHRNGVCIFLYTFCIQLSLIFSKGHSNNVFTKLLKDGERVNYFVEGKYSTKSEVTCCSTHIRMLLYKLTNLKATNQ